MSGPRRLRSTLAAALAAAHRRAAFVAAGVVNSLSVAAAQQPPRGFVAPYSLAPYGVGTADGGLAGRVVRRGAGVVLQGSAGSPDPVVIAVPMGVLLPGAVYEIEPASGKGASPGSVFDSLTGRPRNRDGLSIAKDPVGAPFVGNLDFAATTRLLWSDAAATTEADFDAYLALGFTLPGGDNIAFDADAVIAGVSALVGPVGVRLRGADQGRATVALPVPADPNIAGLHVVMQWVVPTASGLSTSAVFGSLVFAAPFAAQRALERWTQSSILSRWSPAKRALVGQLGQGHHR